MKLQINDAGSWRHVMTFDRLDEATVRERAVKLVAVVNERSKLRILDDQSVPKAWCKGPDWSWEDKEDRVGVLSAAYIQEKRSERSLQREHRIQQQILRSRCPPTTPGTDSEGS